MKRTYLTMLFTMITCVIVAKTIEVICYTTFHFSNSDINDIGLLIYSYIALGAFLITILTKGIRYKIIGLLSLAIASVPALPYLTFMLSIDYRPEDFSYIGGWISAILYILILEFINSHSQFYHQKKSISYPIHSDKQTRCLDCGNWITSSDIFCKHCFKINYRVEEMLKSHPTRTPDDYLPFQKHNNFCCPHCQSFYQHSLGSLSVTSTTTPIRYCKHCHGYFLDDYLKEWCVISDRTKRSIIFFSPIGHLIFSLCLDSQF